GSGPVLQLTQVRSWANRFAIGRSCMSNTIAGFQMLPDIAIGRLSLGVPGELPDVVLIRTGIASLRDAACSAVSILYLIRDTGCLRDDSPPFSKFLVLERPPCSTIYNHRADARQNWEVEKLCIDKFTCFQAGNNLAAFLVCFMGEDEFLIDLIP